MALIPNLTKTKPKKKILTDIHHEHERKSSIKNWQIQQYMQIKIHHDKEEFIAGMQGRNSIYISLNLKMKRTQLYQLMWKKDLLFMMKRKRLLLFFKSLYICMYAYIHTIITQICMYIK